MTTFVDRVVLHVAAGDGGHGCASVRREKFKPLAGPDGADGGNGGDVVLVVDHNTTTLLDYHFHPHQKADSGKAGAGDMRNGATGAPLELPVPNGTVVTTLDGEVLVDGENVTTDADALAAVSVTAEIVAQVKGPKIKIHILKYKNKTGYRKRIGHRQKHTQLKVTGISTSAAADAVKG